LFTASNKLDVLEEYITAKDAKLNGTIKIKKSFIDIMKPSFSITQLILSNEKAIIMLVRNEATKGNKNKKDHL
jgi:hypothetical protein